VKKKLCLIFLCIAVLLTACQKAPLNQDENKEVELVEVSKYANLYQDVVEPERVEDGISWPEGQALPTFANVSGKIDAVDMTAKSKDIKTMVSSLQGIINKKSPRVYLYDKGGESKEGWLSASGFEHEVIKYEEAILKYKDEIKGYIVYDKKQKDTLNLAHTLAAFEDAIVCTEKQAEMLKAEPYNLTEIENYVGDFTSRVEVYQYLYDNLWTNCTRRIIVGLNPDEHIANVRDLAITVKAPIIWLDPKKSEEKKLLSKFLEECEDGKSYYVGWWTEEGAGVQIGSEYGIATIPADYYDNYSVLSAASRELEIPETPATPELENKFYLAMTFSDGDNIQYVQHFMRQDGKAWSNKARGKYPISWTCAPVLLDAGPQILNYYYKTATPNDCLVTGPSGVGYTDPQRWSGNQSKTNLDALGLYATRVDTYLRRTGFRVITIWNFITDEQASVYAKNIPSLTGFTVQERFQGQKGQYIVDGIAPLITTHPRYDGDVPRVQKIIEEQIDKWNGKKPAFMMPQFVAWEVSVAQINTVCKNLTAKYGDKVEFVRADQLMALYREAHDTPYNIALQSENVTASGEDEGFEASKAVNGTFTRGQGWKCSDEGEKWIMIDLQQTYKISRYNLMLASTGYEDKDKNIIGFKVQASSDGENWTDIDEVTANQSSIVDKYVDEFEAQYVRILVTNSGADSAARIQEMELYGIKA